MLSPEKLIMYNRFLVFLPVLSLYLLTLSASAAFPRLMLSFDDIKNPVFQIRSIEVRIMDNYSGKQQLNVSIAEITVQDYVLKNVSVWCKTFQLSQKEILCTDGQLAVAGLFKSPVSIHFVVSRSMLTIHLRPSKTENWQFTLQWDDVFWQVALALEAGKLAHVAAWFPDDEQLPKLMYGKIDGTIQFNGDMTGLKSAGMDLLVDELAFSDQAGLHAGEKIKLLLRSNATLDLLHNHWQWHSDVRWQQGAIFWQPLYFAGEEHALSAQGVFDGKTLNLKDSLLLLSGIGTFKFSGAVDWSDFNVSQIEIDADNVELSALFDQILKPFLADTVFAELKVSGHGDFALSIQDRALREISLNLDDVNIIDQRDRFAFHRINAHIPWQADSATIADISILKGHVLRIPLGSVRVPLEINDFNLLLPQLAVPVLDGVLKLEDFSATYTKAGWRWEFAGKLTPVAMEALTEAMQIQQMHGTLSGYIPEVRYDGINVSVNGVLQINVFDGSVVIHKLKLIEPMGLAPHLTADIAMRNLDLGLLTKTFSFGKVEGRVDIDVKQLELANWEPVHFDARLFSSPGSYTRRISQAAIRNISALGGEGAVVAIQRSFLRFFEEFSYAEIGWRCALRFNICYMGGIESEPETRYTLVKGGGIPAINVMGYNRNVSWQELINRLQRVTQENEPVIQ